MKKSITRFVIALVAFGVFAGALGAQNRITIALSGSPDTLDPQKTAGTLTFQVDKSIYDTLVEPDAKGTIVGALAESWTVSADGLTWTFKLRAGVKFHNGDTFTSADVKATFDRIKANKAAKATEYAGIADLQTPNATTVVFVLSVPSAPFLATLASGWSAILPKSAIDAGNDFAVKPVGTGPFVFKEWTKDSRIVVDKNPNYWMKDKPKLAGVTFQIITDRAVALQGIQTGAIDILDGVESPDVAVLSKVKDVRLDTTLSSIVNVMAMNCSSANLQDVRVRQAISMAIDKQKVLDTVYGGGVVGGTFMDAGDPYYSDYTKLLPYDLNKAKQLLKDAGWKADTVLSMVLPSNYDAHVRAGQMYQAMLDQIGVKAQIKLVDWPTWLSDVYSGGKYDLTVIGHTGKLDPDGRLGGYGTAKTYTHWVNAQADALFAKAKTVADFAARKDLYDQGLKIMATEVPFVFVGTMNAVLAFRTNVTGFVKTPKLDSYDFRNCDKK